MAKLLGAACWSPAGSAGAEYQGFALSHPSPRPRDTLMERGSPSASTAREISTASGTASPSTSAARHDQRQWQRGSMSHMPAVLVTETHLWARKTDRGVHGQQQIPGRHATTTWSNARLSIADIRVASPTLATCKHGCMPLAKKQATRMGGSMASLPATSKTELAGSPDSPVPHHELGVGWACTGAAWGMTNSSVTSAAASMVLC